jgi:uncharacterized membrane protein
MGKNRLEACCDAVMAIVITIMVLELEVPHWSNWDAFRPLIPILLAYVLSFVLVGIYWNNHHHMLHATEHVNGRILWANLHLLFWLSLIPFGTAWMGENGFAKLPTAAYGVVLVMCAASYTILQNVIVAHHGPSSRLATAVGHDRKGKLSLALYVVAVALAAVHQGISLAIYVLVVIMWPVPAPRIETGLDRGAAGHDQPRG